jgi:serine/threonine protein kinase
MLRRNGTVALIDFGISQSKPTSAPGAITQDEAITGTPYYMSPEQVCGDATDERTDLYALGVILYQMLTGAKPYVGDTAEEIMARHRDMPVPKLPAHLYEYQPFVDRMLAKNPGQRLASARELIELIDRMRDAERVRGYELSATSA